MNRSNNSSIPNWWPDHPPIYDIHKSYAENAAQGPFFEGPILERQWAPKGRWIDFLGFKIASPLGVPAGPLLNSQWIKLSGQLGFDVVTYKTIRSQAYAGQPLPNIVFVDAKGQILPNRFGNPLLEIKNPSPSLNDLAITNSFGMPSKDPSFLHEDISKANAALKPGQVMIVSVVGTPRHGEDFINDFVKAAVLAKDAGAQLIEANFSCPNVSTGEGSICTNSDTAHEIAKKIVQAIGHTPLIIKMGTFSDSALMKKVLVAVARAGARAVCGINTISMQVINEKSLPALGQGRLTSGVCGGPIRQVALDFVQNARQIDDAEKLDLAIIGVGGITLPEHFDLFLNAGADIAMTATGMMWDPYLAARYHQTKG